MKNKKIIIAALFIWCTVYGMNHTTSDKKNSSEKQCTENNFQLVDLNQLPSREGTRLFFKINEKTYEPVRLGKKILGTEYYTIYKEKEENQTSTLCGWACEAACLYELVNKP